MTALKAKKRAEELETKGQAMNAYDRTLLLGGSTNGMIVVFDWQNDTNPGKISFQIEVLVSLKRKPYQYTEESYFTGQS